jgi:hypothetical protein
MSSIPRAITSNPHTNLLIIYICRLQIKWGFKKNSFKAKFCEIKCVAVSPSLSEIQLNLLLLSPPRSSYSFPKNENFYGTDILLSVPETDPFSLCLSVA